MTIKTYQVRILQKNAIRNVCGVAILVGKRLHGFKIKEHNINFNSLKYRVLHISIEAEETVGIVNVYAPAQDNVTEKLGSFKDLKKYLSKIDKQKLKILRIFNFVEFNDDRTSG